jgi:hypothetical protein
MAAVLLASKMINDPCNTNPVKMYTPPPKTSTARWLKKIEWILFTKAHYELFTPTVTTFIGTILNNIHILHNSTPTRDRMRKDTNDWMNFFADLALTMPDIQLYDAHVIAYSILLVVFSMCGAEHSFSCKQLDIQQRDVVQCRHLLIRDIGRWILQHVSKLDVDAIEQQQLRKLQLLLLEEQQKQRVTMDIIANQLDTLLLL